MELIKLNKKGVAGIDLLLQVVSALFVLGLLVMVFVMMGTKLETVTYDEISSASNETLGVVNSTSYKSFSVGGWRDVSCSITEVTNGSTASSLVSSGNYTQSGCAITTVAGQDYENNTLNITFTYTYNDETEATTVINETKVSISDAVDFNSIIIIMALMVVLILLVTIIVRQVRSSGMMGTA